MGTTYETAVAPIKALSHDVDGTDQEADVDYKLRTKTLHFPLMIVDVAAATAENMLWVADKDVTVLSATIIPGVDVTAHNTDYKTLTLSVEDGAAGAVHDLAAAVTTEITGGGSWTKSVPWSFAIVPDTNDTIPEGNVLLLTVTHATTGVVIGPYTLQLVVRYD